MRKIKNVSILENVIKIFLKKNRVFSNASKLEIDNQFNYILDKLNSLNDINYIIFQDKIYNNNIYRFLYTDDTYVFILNNESLLTEIKDFLKLNNTFNFKKIVFIENENLVFFKK